MEILPIQSNPIQSVPTKIECSPLSKNGWGWGGVGGQWGPLGPELWGKAGLQGPAWVPPAVAGRVTSSRVPCPTRGHSRGRFASGRITDTPARQDQAAAVHLSQARQESAITRLVTEVRTREPTLVRLPSTGMASHAGGPQQLRNTNGSMRISVCIPRRGGNHELRTRLVQHGRSQVRPQSCPSGRRCHPSPAPRKY